MEAGYLRRAGEDAEEHCARLLDLLQQQGPPAAEELELDDEGPGLEEAEAMLAAKSVEKQSPMVLELLKNLQQCAVPGLNCRFHLTRGP